LIWFILKAVIAASPFPLIIPYLHGLSIGIKVCVESCTYFDIYYWSCFRCVRKAENFSKELTSRLYPQQESKERH
jgi:hypothetical protein